MLVLRSYHRYVVRIDFNMGGIMKTETQEHVEALAKAWDKLGWSDEDAQLECEKVDLDYITVMLFKSESLEGLA